MIELHTLGVVDLRAPPGRDPAAVLRQPKRLALLAYLATGLPRRFHRRDTLVGLFWPELDEEHARAALRRSLYFLRNTLGSDVVTTRGDEEVGVPEKLLWCDAAALEQALGRGEAERGLDLYRGPFLEGLHVTGAGTELQDWLDRQRARLRERAVEAATVLLERAERGGRTAEAARWARRVVDLVPDDEAALRRLIALLERAGDRAGAIRAYQDFTARMDPELEPEPETRALIEVIRAREEAGGSPEMPGTIAVLPFTVRGDARLAYLGEGMVDLLATRLDGAGAIRAVEPRALLHFLRTAPAAPEGAEVARHFGAGHYLTGSIVEAGGQLHATASLHAVSGGAAVRAGASAAGEAGIFDLVDEVARQLLASQRAVPASRLGRIAARTTASLDALRAYLRGERELRAGRYFDAMEGLRAAVEADPSFALAWYRLAAAAAGCALPEAAREMSDRGFEHRGRLSPHDQLVFGAQRAWLRGAVDEAETLFNTITATWPDDVESWFHLGDLLFHCNPLRGRSAAEAREPFERVTRLEPEHVGALVHLTRIAGIEGRRDEMLGLAERAIRASPEGDQAPAMRALRAHALGDRDAIAAVAAELQGSRAITVAIAFADVALYARDLPGAETLVRSFIQVARAPELRALCHILLAHLALAQGDPARAGAELKEAEVLDLGWGLETRGLFATLPFLQIEEADLRAARDALAAWQPAGRKPGGLLVFAMHDALHPAIRAYLLGLLDLRLGDAPGAASWSDELERLRDGSDGLVESLAAELAAARARAEGRIAEALAILARSRPRLWFQHTVASPFFSLASRRYLQAELLREAGRTGEAAGWYRSLAERSPWELVWGAAVSHQLSAMS